MNTLSLSELMDEAKGPIWIINKTSDKYPSGAEVFITINNNGTNAMYVVPRTWLPQEVTSRFSRKVVLESNYFVSAMGNGYIAAISADDARKMLSTPAADRERRRLEEINATIQEASAARGIGKNVTISTGDAEQDEALATEAASKQHGSKGFIRAMNAENGVDLGEEEEDPVPAGFKAWVIKLNGIEDIDDLNSEIKMRGRMSIEEAMYMLRNIENEEVQEKLKAKLRKAGQDI